MRELAALFLLLQTVDYYAEGSKALDERRYQDAAQAFTKAIEADPKDYSGHFNLALADGFLNNDAGATAEYRKTLELKPGLFEAEMNLGLVYMRQKDAAAALPLFEDAARQKPKEFPVVYHLAEAAAASGANDKAAMAFQAALELDPKSAPAEFGFARVLSRQQKLADAAPHYRQAAALDPAYRDGLIELASLYEKSGQSKEAIAIYREVPDNPDAQQRLANLLLRSGEYANAIPNLEQAYARDGSSANLIALAAAYAITNQNIKALPLLEKAAAAEPANFDVRMMYGRALRDGKQFTASAVQFNEAVKLKPNDVRAWSDLAAVLYSAGQLQQSLAAFDRARDLGEDTPGNWFLRAIILDKMQQMKPALAAYQKFLDMSHGEHPDQEFQARQRARIIKSELEKK
jgi:tetratricopeptide (TPR) repeat protein